MKALKKEDITRLNKIKSNYFVSIYIPTHKSGEAVNNGQDIIVFKNQVQKVKNELENEGLQETVVKDFLKEAYALIDNTSFWHEQSDGLAVFVADGFFEYFQVPYAFQEAATIANAFMLKELMPVLHGDGYYYVLSLSENEIKLYEANRNSIKKVTLPEDMPTSFKEATKELDVEKSLQFRSKQTTAGEGTMYHGQGKGKDDKEEFMLEDYLRQVAKGIHEIVKEEEAPMVLYGTEKIKSLYHQANQYNHLIKESLDGNPENVKLDKMQEKSWEVVRNIFQQDRDNLMKKYSELAGTGKASYDIAKIIPAANNGRVESLFVASGADTWGRFDKENQTVEVHEERRDSDENLINKAVLDTFLNGGKVFTLNKENLPEYTVDTPIVAVMRF